MTSNFLKNTDVVSHFDYCVAGSFMNAERIESDRFFVGNHHVPLKEELKHLYKVIQNIFNL